MRSTTFSFALVVTLFLAMDATAQDKAAAPSSDAVEVNAVNSNANVEQKTAAQPTVNTVDSNNDLQGRNKVIERSPEMLECKKIAPFMNDPQ